MTWGDVDRETQAFGLAVPGGLVSNTGVAGLTPPLYPLSGGPGPIRFWRDFMADRSDEVGSIVEFSTIPRDPEYPEQYWGERIYTIAAVYAGDAGEGERLLQPLRELGDQVADFSGRMSYCDIQQLFDALMPFGQYRAYWKSHYLSGLGDAAIDLILAGNASPPSPNTLSSIWNFGGATARVAAADSAFGDRSMPYMMSIDSVWEAPEDDEANIDWTRAFWERMKPHADGGRIYLNFPGLGEEGEELVRRSFGANFARLGEVKRKYDPLNVFRFNQNIKPG